MFYKYPLCRYQTIRAKNRLYTYLHKYIIIYLGSNAILIDDLGRELAEFDDTEKNIHVAYILLLRTNKTFTIIGWGIYILLLLFMYRYASYKFYLMYNKACGANRSDRLYLPRIPSLGRCLLGHCYYAISLHDKFMAIVREGTIVGLLYLSPSCTRQQQRPWDGFLTVDFKRTHIMYPYHT